MATSLPRACSAAASTSGRTPPACWSPRRATAASREVLQRRAFTRLGRGLAPGGDDPGGADRRDRERRRRAARAGRAGWRADDPHRGHRRDPQRRQPRRVLRGDARARRRRGLRARRRGGGAAGLPRRDADARAAAAGRVAVVDVGGGSTEIAVGTLAGGVEWWRSFAVRLGLPRRRLPGQRPALAAPSWTTSRYHARADAGATSTRRRSTPRSRSAAARRRCGGSSAPCSTADSLRRGARRCSRSGPAADVAFRFDLDVQRVRLMPAGLLALDAAAQALGQPLQIGARRPARGRAARPGRGCNNSFTEAGLGVRSCRGP